VSDPGDLGRDLRLLGDERREPVPAPDRGGREDRDRAAHQFACGYFDVEPDSALRIELVPGRAAYWSLGLSNYWYETIGYRDPTSHLNRGTAVADADGRIRIVLAHARPPASAGIPNWLDPKGHREGTMVFRWSRPIDPMPEIRCELVPWRSL